MSDWDSDGDDTPPVVFVQQQRHAPNRARENVHVRGRRGGQHSYFSEYNITRGRGYRREQGNRKVISIPSNKVGLVIGRGGVRIRDLEYKSDAKIKIGDSSGDNTNVTLFGTDFAIDKVQQMIKNLTIDRPPKQAQVNQTNNSNAAAGPTAKVPFLHVNSEGKEVVDWDKAHEACDQAQQRRWAEVPPIVKNFYKEDPFVAAMSPEEVIRWRLTNNNILVKRTVENPEVDKIPNPVLTFEHAFKDYPEILGEIYKQGFTQPSPIQSQAWPILLKGEDMIGIAQTGTGKTLAFLLPALIHIDGQPTPRDKRPGPIVLILVPTRELALQIEGEVNKYNNKGIKSVCVYGGGDQIQQIDIVSKEVDIVIATPEGLSDLIKADHIQAMHFSYIVLDEADKMLDMGFEPQIRMVLYDVRPECQYVMTSATWSSAIRQLAEKYMKNPIHVGSLDLAAVHNVTQIVKVVEESEKDPILFEFIQKIDPSDRVIIFCAKKDTAADITAFLACKGFYSESLHGNMDQTDRESALDDLMNGVVNILVATDVASRGIDIKDLTHVINLDFPRNIEEYVHRIERTGRAGRTGIALSLMTKYDGGNARALINILKEANQEVPDELIKLVDSFDAKKARGVSHRGRGRGRGSTRW